MQSEKFKVQMFELTEQITIDGKAYRIRSDFRVVLEIFVMLQDPELDDGDRTEALMRMFYVDRPQDVKAAIETFASFVDPRPRRDRKRPGLVKHPNIARVIESGVFRGSYYEIYEYFQEGRPV